MDIRGNSIHSDSLAKVVTTTRTTTVVSSISSQSTRLTTITGPPPPPAIWFCKQSTADDVKDVMVLDNANTKAIFGEVDILDQIEKNICRSLFNKEKELVAFIAVQDHPNIPSLEYCSWINWIRCYYRLDTASSWNSLFIHYLVWDSRYPNFFTDFLKSFYKNTVQLDYFLLVVPPGLHIFKELSHLFTVIYPKSNSSGNVGGTAVQTLYLNLRSNVISKLIVRKAGEEDNIDVQPILNYQLDILKYVFGDFKLRKVIDLKDKNKTVLVAEKTSGVTVGVMALTQSIDYQHVRDFYYMPLYDGFSRMELTRSDISKLTPRHVETTMRWCTEDDLQSLNTGVFDETKEDVESDDDKESEFTREDVSRSSVLLDDDDSEFRIVDPAMEYLVSKKRLMQRSSTDLFADSIESFDSSFYIECNAYYGRPSRPANCQTPVATSDVYMPKDPYNPYTGPEDGFKISLFALHPDLDIRYAFDLLEASFECFPEKHYCLLSLPTSYQGSPLTKYFVRLTPRLSRDFPQELYFVHRNSVLSEFIVRPLSMMDFDGISELVENFSHGGKIRKDFISLALEGESGTLAYVLECEDCIVGVAVVSKNFRLEQTVPHYRLEELFKTNLYSWESHGLLRHVIVSAVFLKAAPYFLRQIMHQAGLETLSYCLLPAEIMIKMELTIPTVLGELCPICPRTRIKYDLSAMDIYTPEDFVIYQEQAYSLFVVTQKYLNVPKVELNYRIVVVGASDTALSFLENLIFRSSKKHVRYNNLTMVSLHGLPLELRPHTAGDRMIPHSGLYSRDYLARLGLQTHVNILYGIVTVINRTEKMICLNDKHWLRYDYLFLFTGTQFCKPSCDITNLNSEDASEKLEDIGDTHPQHERESGDNFFLVNTTADSIIALGSLKKLVANRKTGKIVVYGSCIHIYTCTEALLVFGVPGKKIVLIERADTCSFTGLDTNSVIEKAVIDSIEKAGITVYHGYYLINWSMQHKIISRVMFRSDNNVPLIVDCLAFFCYGNKTTSAKTYKALADSGIVYNDGIIIDSMFRTNDEFVFAAGPGTKYSSKYQEKQMDHGSFSSIEVGLKASLIFRQLVEPWDPEDSRQVNNMIPQLKDPVTLVAQLPGGWYYVRISAPGRPLPLECQMHGQGESGPVLVTGDPIDANGPGYFQLSLSDYNTVREIACLSMKEIPYHNLQKLYGKHERLLNNLLERYNLGLITDLFAFFSQPWAYAIYTTGFDTLVRQCAEIFQADEEAFDMIQHFEEGLNSKAILSRMSLGNQETSFQKYAESSVPLYVEHLTLRYVSELKLQLPMYLTDDIITSILRTYSLSPLHKDSTIKTRTKFTRTNTE